jgi:hypothetical protein
MSVQYLRFDYPNNAYFLAAISNRAHPTVAFTTSGRNEQMTTEQGWIEMIVAKKWSNTYTCPAIVNNHQSYAELAAYVGDQAVFEAVLQCVPGYGPKTLHEFIADNNCTVKLPDPVIATVTNPVTPTEHTFTWVTSENHTFTTEISINPVRLIAIQNTSDENIDRYLRIILEVTTLTFNPASYRRPDNNITTWLQLAACMGVYPFKRMIQLCGFDDPKVQSEVRAFAYACNLESVIKYMEPKTREIVVKWKEFIITYTCTYACETYAVDATVAGKLTEDDLKSSQLMIKHMRRRELMQTYEYADVHNTALEELQEFMKTCA